ncbi:MAG TPA: cobaltochelatase subunit CobN [Pyrinomonadaceae bacterium]|nr:cobaltochelatase subunit CobN [Pyrinomonadaceae bacterium]
MKVTVLYVGSSLLAPLKNAEREINHDYKLDLRLSAYNFGAALNQDEWSAVDHDLSQSDIVFITHVMDGENAARLLTSLEKYQKRHHAVVVINCMPDLMRRTRLGKLDVSRIFTRMGQGKGEKGDRVIGEGAKNGRAINLMSAAGSWIGRQTLGRQKDERKKRDHGAYLKLVDRVPALLRFVPNAGTLRDVKNYLYLFCYFLQPTPANIRTMILFAVKHYVPDPRLQSLKIKLPPPATMPSVAIYHPDAPALFETFAAYRKWYQKRFKFRVSSSEFKALDPETTIGLLLMRPQIVSNTRKHYDALIRAIEAEGLSVIAAISTLMDNRQACETFFVEDSKPQLSNSRVKDQTPKAKDQIPRVSQIVSLTGFSFVGGPAMNDSAAASDFLRRLNVPYRSAVSLDTQTIEAWRDSQTGLNPIQAGMQIAIPEIDGATEPFVYGGIPAAGVEPVALEDRCERLTRRLGRWNRLRTAPRSELKLALLLFCFPPNKGNVGTAADLDVFPSVWETLSNLKRDGYNVDVPASADSLRDLLLGGNSELFGATANVHYRMNVEEYRHLCPYVDEIEKDWGRAPGSVNSFANELLIQGVSLGNVFVGVQPTFGYEGDPMRLMMARSGAPHHGFMAFYTYLSRVLNVDAAIHVGTHGSLEFMPGKQVGLSGECWPDRLIGELPNIYLYSVNNPSEGSIAKRRSYAELVSYLTPPMENAGLYKELATLKDLVLAYRESSVETERERLFAAIQECQQRVNLQVPASESIRPRLIA